MWSNQKERLSHDCLEHLPTSLAVTGGEDGCVNQQEVSALEVLMNGHDGRLLNPKDGGEGSSPGPQVGEVPQVLQIVPATSLEWIVLKREGVQEVKTEVNVTPDLHHTSVFVSLVLK